VYDSGFIKLIKMKLRAYGNHIIVIRDETVKEKGGLVIPDSALQKPNKGTILSVGWLCKKTDATFKEGQICYWNRHVGQEIEVEDMTVTILTSEQLLFHGEA
jgi:chaperonin GroES